MSRKLLSDWDPSPATGVKNTRPGGEAADEIFEQGNIWRIATA